MSETGEKTKRPDRTSMEGMIWNAHHVLENAMLSPEGIPKKLFQVAVGICLISVVEVGFIFSGNVGTGILLKKRESGGGWSPPTACGLTGVGWGLLVGGSIKDLLIFILDEASLKSIAYDKAGIKIGTQVEATIGPLGRSANLDLSLSDKGIGNTIAIAYSKGAFLGLSIEGAIIGARHRVNGKFYNNTNISPQDILNGDANTLVPSDKVTLLDEVYTMLNQLAEGTTTTTTTNEEKVQAAAQVAEQASAEIHQEQKDDIVEINAEVEAAKEESEEKK